MDGLENKAAVPVLNNGGIDVFQARIRQNHQDRFESMLEPETDTCLLHSTHEDLVSVW